MATPVHKKPPKRLMARAFKGEYGPFESAGVVRWHLMLLRPLDVAGKRLFTVRVPRLAGTMVAAASPAEAREMVKQMKGITAARMARATVTTLAVLQPRDWITHGVPCIECDSNGLIPRVLPEKAKHRTSNIEHRTSKGRKRFAGKSTRRVE